jgi:hypothetical protein
MQCGRYKKVRVKDLDSHAIKALVRTENLIRTDCVTESPKTLAAMIALVSFFLTLFASPFKSKADLKQRTRHSDIN